jgi:hypothetical protein
MLHSFLEDEIVVDGAAAGEPRTLTPCGSKIGSAWLADEARVKPAAVR